MLVTALSPVIGYDKASAISHKADDEGTSLREAALTLGVSASDFDWIVQPWTRHPITPKPSRRSAAAACRLSGGRLGAARA
jgi:aspartate ammonia-lyase